jgi:Putative inner membrane protein (DUF1819)
MSIYTTELSKGQGAIDETLSLLQVWEPGMSAELLAQKTIAEGILGRLTAVRTRDLAQRVFARRFLGSGGAAAANLKYLIEQHADRGVVKQIMLLYTSRLHVILRDFIAEIYWNRYSAGAERISRSDAEQFILRAQTDGRIAPPWSETMRLRVARYLTGTLADFGLLAEGKQTAKALRPFRLLPGTGLFLAHEIHFHGFSDNSMLQSPDWKVFGLARGDVVRELDRLAATGHYIMQYSGDLLRISWRYQTMEECLDAIARS